MKQTAYLTTKWISRVSLVIFLMSNALYWGFSRMGMWYSTCPSESTDWLIQILNGPFFIPALHLAFTISSAMTIWMVAEFKFRHRLPEKAREVWLHFKRTWFVVLPVLGLIYWFHSGSPIAIFLGVPWIWTTCLSCLFILIQYDRKPETFILEEFSKEEEEEYFIEAA